MRPLNLLSQRLEQRFSAYLQSLTVERGELTAEISNSSLRSVCLALRDELDLHFEVLLDVCGVDYLDYGRSEWVTQHATSTGFDRGVDPKGTHQVHAWDKPRFAAVYHLLSLKNNHRLRLRVFAKAADQKEAGLPTLDSIVSVWPSADWYEREIFDLYGIVFKGHPDLRRILTDYGFVGHPFRKDFPLIGHVEVKYDAEKKQVINTPVTSVVARTLVPKVIRSSQID